ncbi:hypothetical protein Z046_30345 [Pseudomonas aeruginosa VRFPA09]|nr:hypothetical protein M770_32055 [Pseudomonas aeruginosa VRFPA03]EVT88867.1 hypothetical protein Z046_30345 [Pseudomonas aeruginosa VRFPA09]
MILFIKLSQRSYELPGLDRLIFFNCLTEGEMKIMDSFLMMRVSTQKG